MIETIHNFDIYILEFVRNRMNSWFLDFIMPLITKIGDGGLVWIAVALAFMKSRSYRTDGVILIVTLLLSTLVGNFTLKPLFARMRPCDINTTVPLLIERPTDFSFPSGHTMSSFAAASVIFHANAQMGIAAFILATLIAFSRIYLYVHYPSDILAGIILGILFSAVVIWFFKIIPGFMGNSIYNDEDNDLIRLS